jgi:hypothetical protein
MLPKADPSGMGRKPSGLRGKESMAAASTGRDPGCPLHRGTSDAGNGIAESCARPAAELEETYYRNQKPYAMFAGLK